MVHKYQFIFRVSILLQESNLKRKVKVKFKIKMSQKFRNSILNKVKTHLKTTLKAFSYVKIISNFDFVP